MSKKFIIFILIILLVIVPLLFFMLLRTPQGDESAQEGRQPFFGIFGDILTPQEGQQTDTNGITGPETEDDEALETNPLVRLYDFPLAGIATHVTQRPVFENGSTIPLHIFEEDTDRENAPASVTSSLHSVLNAFLDEDTLSESTWSDNTTDVLVLFQETHDLPSSGMLDADTRETLHLFQREHTPPMIHMHDAPSVLFTTRLNGYVFTYFPLEDFRELTTQTPIPLTYEALFGVADESLVALSRFLSNNETTISTHAHDTHTDEGIPFPDNITSIAPSPDKQTIASLIETTNESMIVLSSPTHTRVETIFTSPLQEWRLSWPHRDIILLATKASAHAPGFVYAINPDTHSMQRLTGNAHGLTAILSPNGEDLFVSEQSEQNNLHTYILNTESNTRTDLPFKTIADKCAWAQEESHILYCGVPDIVANESQQPDAWYKGRTQFSDSLWRIDTTHGTATEVARFSQFTDEPDSVFDIIDPHITHDDRYFVFSNKHSNSGWIFTLPREEIDQEVSS